MFLAESITASGSFECSRQPSGIAAEVEPVLTSADEQNQNAPQVFTLRGIVLSQRDSTAIELFAEAIRSWELEMRVLVAKLFHDDLAYL